MGKIIPEIAITNMDASVKFYTALGFKGDQSGVVDEQGSQWESLLLGDAGLWLIRKDIVVHGIYPGSALGSGLDLFCNVDDVDAVYKLVQEAGLQANIVRDIETQWYGLREFKLADPDGYTWTFNQQVGGPNEAQTPEVVDSTASS